MRSPTYLLPALCASLRTRPAAIAVAAGAAALAAATAHAQVPLAANPDSPAARLHYQSLPALGALDSASTDWRAAHRAVAEFPRGHTDLVRWEARQAAASKNAAPALSTMPDHSTPPAAHPPGHAAPAQGARP